MRVNGTFRCVLLAAAMVAATSAGFTGTAAHAQPSWGPANAPVHPGVQTISGGSQCTANFVFYDSANNVYIGQSAHCTSTSGPTVTNGCQAGSLGLNTSVQVRGATKNGTMVYNSWLAMQAAGEPVSSYQCQNNDFALIKLHSDDYGRVNPSIPFWGGPMGLNTSGARSLTRVYTYGNSGLRFGLTPLSPKTGVSGGTSAGGWKHKMWTVTPGIPGDSGSAVLDEFGNALGTLSTVSSDGSNGVGDLESELDYLRAHSTYTTLQLALGTVAFDPIV